MLNSNYSKIISYEYDSWGKLISIKDSNGNIITDSNNIGLINPYRYRSYRYDNETGYYYLQSRYYNPEWGRFLNADTLISTGQGLLSHNMTAYANNNPINMMDPEGSFAILIGATILGIVVGTTTSIKKMIDHNNTIGKMTFYDWIGYVSEGAQVASVFMSLGYLGQGIYDLHKTSIQLQSSHSSTSTVGKGTQNPIVKAKAMQGQAIHKSWDYGPNTAKEVKITANYRVDAINFNKNIIYELKPNNHAAINRGINQLNNYTRAASERYGGNWTGILIKYDN